MLSLCYHHTLEFFSRPESNKQVLVISDYKNNNCSVIVSAGPGVYLCLKGKTNFTGGIVPINVIGETNIIHPHLAVNNYGNNGLQCITDKPNCCRVDNRPPHDSIRIGEWYFPNGTAVPILGYGNNRAITFYRNRGYNDSTVNLNRVSSNVMSPTGNFCCQVPDSMGRNQTVCVNISEFLSTSYHNNYMQFLLYNHLATVVVTIMSIPPATSIAGDNLTLQCTAKGAGDFLTQIEWLNLESTSGMNIQSNGTSIQLQFIPLLRSHTGVYTCQVTVGDTNFTENYPLHVQRKFMCIPTSYNHSIYIGVQ